MCLQSWGAPQGTWTPAQNGQDFLVPTVLDTCALGLLLSCLQDLPGALSEAQIAEQLGLHDIKSRPWAIFKTSAIKGEGLFEVRSAPGLCLLLVVGDTCLCGRVSS